MGKLNIDIISKMVKNEKIRWTNHVVLRLCERNINGKKI